MNTSAYQITRSTDCVSAHREVIATVESIEAGIAFLTERAEANGFVVLATDIEDGAASVCTAKPKTFLMNIYEIAEA